MELDQLDFTKDEIEVVSEYLERKIIRLEEAGLTDSKCYPLLYSFRKKLLRKHLQNNKKVI